MAQSYVEYRAAAISHYQGGGASRVTTHTLSRQARRARRARADKLLEQECSGRVTMKLARLIATGNFQWPKT